MRKHYKLISSITCLILCVCMVTFGVYAAQFGLVTLKSTVSFTPTTAKLKIFGGIAGQAGFDSTTVERQKYYACNYGSDKGNYTTESDLGKPVDKFGEWTYGEIYFAEYLETGEITHPDPISFYIQITNYVEVDVNYTVTINNPESCFNYSFGYDIVDNNSKDLNSETGATKAGWWYVGANSSSKPTFHNNPTKPGSKKRSFTGTETKVVDLSDIDTTLKTIMLVVTVGVVDANTSFTNEFNFTIAAVASNNY